MLKRAHEMNPKSAPILAELGRTLAALQAWKEASDAYAKAVDLAPQDPGIRRGHAAALLALDLPTLAETEYRAALALHEDAPTLSGLGVTLDLQNRHDDAVTAFRRALELDPDSAATRTNLGLSLALWGSSNEAIGLLAPMAASGTADARQRQNLALVFGLAGDVDQARAVSKIDLNEEAVRNNLAYYETLRGLTPLLRMRAMLGKEAPSVASTGAAAVASATGEPTARPVDATPPSATPDKPSRAAELAPARIPVKSPKAASATSSRIELQSSEAKAAIAVDKPRLKAEIATPVKSAKPKIEAAKAEPVKAETASKGPEVSAPIDPEVPAVAAMATKAPVEAPTLESTVEAPTASAAPETDVPANDNLPPAGNTSADASTIAEPAVTANAPEVPDVSAPAAAADTSKDTPVPAVAVEGTEPKADAALTSEPEPAALNAAASAEPSAEKAEQAAATTSSDAFVGASYGAVLPSAPSAQEAGAPALPDAVLPEVTVRVGGVPLATVPQTQVTTPEHAIVESTEAKSADVTATDGESSDVPPPATEPIKRDGPIRLLPQSHAAIDPLY
jgi:Flp pilus assembly protein TadD